MARLLLFSPVILASVDQPDWSPIDDLPSAALFLDAAGAVVHVNARALKVLGWPKEANAACGRILPLPLQGEPRPAFCSGCAGPAEGLDCWPIERAEGRMGCVGYRIVDLAEQGGGRPWRYALTLRDIAGWKQLRDERDRLLQLAAVGQALPTILHELKNPLAAVTANVEVLIEETTSESLQKDLHGILSELRRLALGFEGIGAVGRNLRTLRHHPVDEALREACVIMSRRATACGLTLRVDIADMPLLPFDPAVLRAVLFNLITNSIHACQPGATIAVHSYLTNKGREFVLNVVDTGSGMTAEVLAKCTQMFFSTKRSGSGIGLALCSSVAERAGGRLEIESVVGFGTSIRLRVPTNAPEA